MRGLRGGPTGSNGGALEVHFGNGWHIGDRSGSLRKSPPARTGSSNLVPSSGESGANSTGGGLVSAPVLPQPIRPTFLDDLSIRARRCAVASGALRHSPPCAISLTSPPCAPSGRASTVPRSARAARGTSAVLAKAGTHCSALRSQRPAGLCRPRRTGINTAELLDGRDLLRQVVYEGLREDKPARSAPPGAAPGRDK